MAFYKGGVSDTETQLQGNIVFHGTEDGLESRGLCLSVEVTCDGILEFQSDALVPEFITHSARKPYAVTEEGRDVHRAGYVGFVE